MRLWHALVLAALLPACTRAPAKGASTQTAPSVEVAAGNAPSAQPVAQAAAAQGAQMKDQTVGDPRAFDNLTIFPIYANKPIDVGVMTTLDDALAKGKADVREVGADGRTVARGDDDGAHAQVNTLVIENKGDVPIYVLAGTIVKGGNQDRQIGQDFIIESKQTVPVDAFCVEHGRWTGSRDGRATGGKFGTSQRIVTSSVRAAAQYKKNQGEVWAKVDQVNQAHKKSAASGTLFATMDAPDVEKKSAALAEKVNAFLKSSQPSDKLVGFAFAVDGQVKGARWFASHKVFALFQSTLVNGVTLDALTAQAARNGAPPPAAPPPKNTDVVSFVDDVEKVQAAEQRDTAAANANEYKESSKAYGSKAYRKPSAATPAAPKVPISVDVLAK